MSSIKKSVMLSSETTAYILARNKDENEISWSESLNEGFKILKFISQQALPELSQEEWTIILNTYAGSTVDNVRFPLRIASDIMDDLGVIDPSLLKKEIKATVEKVYEFNQIEQFAIMDFVRKFWAKNWDCDWEEIVEKIKNS